MTETESWYSFIASSLFPVSMAFTTFLIYVRNRDLMATLCCLDFSAVRALLRAEAIFAKIYPLLYQAVVFGRRTMRFSLENVNKPGV